MSVVGVEPRLCKNALVVDRLRVSRVCRPNWRTQASLNLWLTEPELQELRAREVTLFEDGTTCVERVEIDVGEIDRFKAAVVEEDSQLLSIGRISAETQVTGAAVDDPSGGEALTVDRRRQAAVKYW